MKFNLDCDIDNLAYILYMQEQEEKKAETITGQNKIPLGDFESHEQREK